MPNPTPSVPTVGEARDDVDGAYDAFRERVAWFYRNAPECQEARKHSFSRQTDVAFLLAMDERLAAVRAETVREYEADELRTDPIRGLRAMRRTLYAILAKVGDVRLSPADMVAAGEHYFEAFDEPDGTKVYRATVRAGGTA